MANKIKLHKGDVNDIYEPSDSENEYTEREKTLLRKVRKGRHRDADPEQELMAFQQDESDEEDDGQFDDEDDLDDDFNDKTAADSDFEEEGDDGVPSDRAWGKKRRDFYATDFVDQDYSSYNAREEDMAEQEEAEARAIQQRLAKQMDEADFSLDVFASGDAAATPKDKKKQKKVEAEGQQTYLKTDLSQLSKRQQEQLFKKDSPEFESLVHDFRQRLEESRDVLDPVLAHLKDAPLEKHPLVEFVVTKNNLILNYCSNVAFYLVLKAKRVPVKNHPIVKRLVQMRQLLVQLEEKYASVVKPQLDKLLRDIADGKEIVFDAAASTSKATSRAKKLGLVKAIDAAQRTDSSDSDSSAGEEAADDDRTFADKLAASESDEANENAEDEEMAEGDERREITYQMMKNKGLTPHRKKELRNPRVKHRNKFRKALIRRKGAVRTVRKEIKRYDGEKFGIKAGVKKGIKIK